MLNDWLSLYDEGHIDASNGTIQLLSAINEDDLVARASGIHGCPWRFIGSEVGMTILSLCNEGSTYVPF